MAAKQRLEPGFTYVIPEEEHRHTRGHQAHLDVTEHLDPGVTIKVDFEVSTDDGLTWQYGGGFTREGGPAEDKHGAMPWATVHFGHETHGQIPPAQRRRVRGTIQVFGGPVNTRGVHIAGTAGASVDKAIIPKD